MQPTLPVLGRAQRAAALHLAVSAAATDLCRPSLAEAAVAAAWPSGLLPMLCAGTACCRLRCVYNQVVSECVYVCVFIGGGYAV